MIFEKSLLKHDDKVWIDNRESQERINQVRKFFGKDNTIVAQLETGDYVYNDEVCIEHKKASDLISSIMNKRIFKQVSRMRRDYNHHCILVEGNPVEYIIKSQIQPHKHFSFSVEQWNGTYISLEMVTKVLFANNLNHAVRLMNLFFKKSTDGKDRHYQYLEKYEDPITTFLSSIQGINYKTGKLVKESLHLDNLEDLLGLNQKNLTNINGIGLKTADKILGAIGK